MGGTQALYLYTYGEKFNMSVFLATVNVVLPIGLAILAGMFLRRLQYIDDNGTNVLNATAFRLLLPCMVFYNVYGKLENADRFLKLLLFCILGYAAAFILITLLVCKFDRDVYRRGCMIQGCIHNSFIVIGMSLLENLYPGEQFPALGFVAAFMILMNNLGSGIALQLYNDERGSLGGVLKNLLKNPIIISCVLAVVLDIAKIKPPTAIMNAVSSLSGAAVPICLVALGSSLKFDLNRSITSRALVCCLVKLVILPLIFIPLGIAMNFRGEAMIVVLVMSGSPTAPVTYSLAASMGADKELASHIVLLSNCISMVTIFICMYFMQLAGVL